MAEQEIRYDIDGYELVTNALRELMSQYPGLQEGEDFRFNILTDADDKAIFPTTGAVIKQERESITGHVNQLCMYPFTVVFRASGLSQFNKITVKEWLDNLGRWLEKQSIKVGSSTYKIDEYPVLTGTRKIERIVRQTPAYASTINDDKSEDWIINLSVEYTNEFDK